MRRSTIHRQARPFQSGFGMLEIVITMFLVLIGLLVVASSYLAIARAQHYSERMDTATMIVSREMERIRNRSWDLIQDETGDFGEYPESPDFRHTVAVETIGTLKQVTLRVYFDQDRRRSEVVTYVANL
jgi:hypothetical protein